MADLIKGGIKFGGNIVKGGGVEITNSSREEYVF